MRGVVETGTTTVDEDGPQRLALLASALAGRTVAVAPGEPGEPAWTDGITVFVDAAEPPTRQLESVTVQASLLAGGGLEPDVLRKLGRKTALARRYLAVEGHRALAANEDLLPYGVRSMIDLGLVARVGSPADSLQLALSGEAAYDARYPDCEWLNADCDEDGDVDFFDIDGFLGLLGTSCP